MIGGRSEGEIRQHLVYFDGIARLVKWYSRYMTTEHSLGCKWVNLYPRASAKERGGAQDDWPIKPDAISKRKEKEEKDGREKGK